MSLPRALRALAQEAGIQLVYRDLEGRRHVTSVDAVLAVLQALGLSIRTPEEAPQFLRERWQQKLERHCEPVHVAFADRNRPRLSLYLSRLPEQPLDVTVRQEESGEILELRVPYQLSTHWPRHQFPFARVLPELGFQGDFLPVTLELPLDLPIGYYEVQVTSPDGFRASTWLFVRPATAMLPTEVGLDQSWGLFLPLYALWSSDPSDGATYTRLGELVHWTQQSGGTLCGTLPLLPTFLEPDLFDPSPYAPVSRLFWNEFYVDAERIAGSLGLSLTCLLVTETTERGRLVDYARSWSLRRSALQQIATELQQQEHTREFFQHWLAQHPLVAEYAHFRARVEREGRPSNWRTAEPPFGQRTQVDLATASSAYAVAQWLAYQQLAEAGQNHLYLDLPLGVHPEGFDVWRWPHLFVRGVSAGAPPDPFFAEGQVWGFPPLHPDQIRDDGYRYFRQVLAHHLRFAKLLRIDHVMGFHRLYWVPHGALGHEGIYVRYPANEFYAVLAIESHRARCAIAGEDLGTVPARVRHAMTQNGLLRLYVLPFARQDGSFAEPPPLSVASLDTHDLPPFAALWDEWGAVIQAMVREWLQQNNFLPTIGDDETALEVIVRGLLTFLGDSPSSVVLINLEDLWLEREPQNRPGTGLEEPNWRRVAQFGLQQLVRDPAITSTLAAVAQARRKGSRG